MMTKIVVLRDKPELKILLNTEMLEINDASDPRNYGVYPFKEIRS